jgi:hypothetical protein
MPCGAAAALARLLALKRIISPPLLSKTMSLASTSASAVAAPPPRLLCLATSIRPGNRRALLPLQHRAASQLRAADVCAAGHGRRAPIAAAANARSLPLTSALSPPPPPLLRRSSTSTSSASSAVSGAAPTAAEQELATGGELPKVFDPAVEEAAIYASWEASGAFSPPALSPPRAAPPPSSPAPPGSGGGRKPPFVVAMPPPNVTGVLHMGHAMFVTLQDAMVRHARMQGRETLWLPGTDHAGIATQLVVERGLEAEGGSRLGLGREAFEERVWEWKRSCGGSITGQLKVLGASCDWSRERFTLDDGLSAAVPEAFVGRAVDGRVYRGS